MDNSGGISGNAILAFKKNGTTGALTFLGTTDSSNSSPLSFLGNNQYAYNSNCINGNASWFAAHRNSDGTLDSFFINPPIPSNPSGIYCPLGVAADPANNLAVALQTGQNAPTQLAVYTADISGNLTTNSTAANMPVVSEVFPFRMGSVSPTGNLLAVCGGGVQVFHFNGSNPVTPYTHRLSYNCGGLDWDKHNHLYTFENARVKAWRITPNFCTAASPYPMKMAAALTVLSK